MGKKRPLVNFSEIKQRKILQKILPLLEKLKINCQQFGAFHKNLCIDE